MHVVITLEDYHEMDENMQGICLACGEYRDGCEPDARDYKCDACGERRVVGPHWLLVAGQVE